MASPNQSVIRITGSLALHAVDVHGDIKKQALEIARCVLGKVEEGRYTNIMAPLLGRALFSSFSLNPGRRWEILEFFLASRATVPPFKIPTSAVDEALGCFGHFDVAYVELHVPKALLSAPLV